MTDLTRDNKTEHLRTINILKRFNVYQEVVLAAIYKMFHLEVTPSYLSCSSVNLSFMSRYWKSPSPNASQERLEIHNGPEKLNTTMMHIQYTPAVKNTWFWDQTVSTFIHRIPSKKWTRRCFQLLSNYCLKSKVRL